ncbi:flagellar basal body rod protein FlgB [Ottowia sp. VDI28]|uniref:flagellar basal body rod protein FlgB n=1 Tax=Ottowia sp. VDI28 TaxID=3133968 RepID=UPI003C2DD6BB
METLKLASSGFSRPAAVDDDFNARALLLRGQRQALLASNIANADTPGYRAQDIDFKEALRSATEPTMKLSSTSTAHLPTTETPQSTLAFARYALSAQPSLDGNTVDMDRERASFAQNSILYQFAVSNLDDEYKEFKMASSDPRR